MSLSFEDRKKTILKQLEKQEKVQVHMLAKELEVSPETIRRDLDRLEKDGKLKKVYGGAIKVNMDIWEPPFSERTQINSNEKSAIGRLAASLVNEGETIMIDNGTTPLEVIRHIRDRKDVTIVTHSVTALLLAMEMFKGKVFFTGGELNPQLQTVTGSLSEQALQQFNVHKAFISIGGISMEEGITDYTLNEASISRKMMERSIETFILADHSKFGKRTFAKISSLQDVSAIITDQGCSTDWIQQLEENGIDILIAN